MGRRAPRPRPAPVATLTAARKEEQGLRQGRGSSRAVGWGGRSGAPPAGTIAQGRPCSSSREWQGRAGTHHDIGRQRGVGHIHVGRQSGHHVGQHCQQVGRWGARRVRARPSVRKGLEPTFCSREPATILPPKLLPPTDTSPSYTLTNAEGQGEEVDQPEQRKRALQLQRPPHDVGCTVGAGSGAGWGLAMQCGARRPLAYKHLPGSPPTQAPPPGSPKTMLHSRASTSSSAILATR